MQPQLWNIDLNDTQNIYIENNMFPICIFIIINNILLLSSTHLPIQ